MADVMVEAECVPYLQFGEVQWWYFPHDWYWDSDPLYLERAHASLPFYDSYTTSTFAATYGRAMHVFVDSSESTESFPEEAEFLPGLIGAFTDPGDELCAGDSFRRAVRGAVSAGCERFHAESGDQSAGAVERGDARLFQDRELYVTPGRGI